MNKKLSLEKNRWGLRLIVWGLALIDLLLQIVLRGVGLGVENRGVSFGFLAEGNLGILIALVFLMILSGWIWKKNESSFALDAILAGGVANAIVRLIFGGVWDYLPMPFVGLNINLADVLISVGVFSYILRL